MQQALYSPRVYFTSAHEKEVIESLVQAQQNKADQQLRTTQYTFPHHHCKCGLALSDYTEHISQKSSSLPQVIKSGVCQNENCKLRWFVCLFCTTITKEIHKLAEHVNKTHSFSQCLHCPHQFSNSSPKDLFQHYIAEHISEASQNRPKKQKTRCYELPTIPLVPVSTCHDDTTFESVPDIDGNLLDEMRNQVFKETFTNEYYRAKGSVSYEPKTEPYLYDDSKPKIQAAITAAQAQSTLPTISVPERDQSIFAYFPTFEFFHFAIVDYMMNGVSDRQAGVILNSLLKVYLKDNFEMQQSLPQNMGDLKQHLNKLPIGAQLDYNNSKYRKLSVPQFSLADLVARTLNSNELLSQMQFHSNRNIETGVAQFVESESFKKLAAKCDPDSLPIAVMLFYDDFRKNRLSPGKCGGLYAVILNLNRKQRSKPVNIFGIALIENEDEYYNALYNVTVELKELFKPHQAKLALFNAFAKIQVVCPLVLADMPQRHDNCCLLSLTSNNGACCHCNESSSRLGKTPTKNGSQTVFTKSLRTVPEMRNLYQKYNSIAIESKKAEMRSTYGIKFWVDTHGNTITNPLWELYDLYGVDAFEAHVVDFFHVTVLGLLRKHFKLMLKRVFNEADKQYIEAELKLHSVAGFSLPALKNVKFWNGDHWLRFMAISPLILSELMCGDAGMKQHFECWVQHIDWLLIMLKPKLSKAEILTAEQMCWNWRKKMVQLYPKVAGKDKVATPNFHAILHVFPQALMYGPPVLYWARPFEHKHAIYRGYMANSNNFNVGKFCMVKEKMLDCALYLYPNIKIMKPLRKQARSDILPDDYVKCLADNRTYYCKVVSINSEQAIVLTYDVKESVTEKHSVHNCLVLSTMATAVRTVPKAAIFGRFSVVYGFINRFEVLDMTKL